MPSVSGSSYYLLCKAWIEFMMSGFQGKNRQAVKVWKYARSKLEVHSLWANAKLFNSLPNCEFKIFFVHFGKLQYSNFWKVLTNTYY